MFARLTADNRITLPDTVVCDFPDVQVFDVVNDDGRIVLTPVIPSKADAVRAKLAARGITESDVADAVAWARSSEAHQ